MSKNIGAKLVKELREKTGAGMMEAKSALVQSGGDLEAAVDVLRKKGQLRAHKKASRVTGQGIIDSYIHGEGQIGVLLEVNCETDFVARNEEFKKLVHDLSLQIAASNPLYISRQDVPAETVEKEKQIYREQALSQAKGADILEKIVSGRLEKYYQEVCLLEQAFIKDPDIVIQELVNQKISTIGENIQIRRFTRYVLGE